MADLGMNIVTVIHQPRYSVFSLFHEVLLLGKAGRTVFQGASTSALPYFTCLGFQLPANENPADFFLDIVSGCVTCHANADFQTEVRFPVAGFCACSCASPYIWGALLMCALSLCFNMPCN